VQQTPAVLPPSTTPDPPLARTFVQEIGTGIAAIDARGKQIDVNDAFCAMVGWRREELLGAEPPFCYWPAEARAET